MITLIVNRKYYSDCTVSRVSIENMDFQCFFLELPDFDNQKNISCIPEGEYLLELYNSPSRGCLVPQYVDVPNRTYIQIHAGNFTRQIKGCQLIGDGVKWIDCDGVPDVTNSESTFKKLMPILKVQEKIRAVITS